jgi:hypothetical protein
MMNPMRKLRPCLLSLLTIAAATSAAVFAAAPAAEDERAEPAQRDEPRRTERNQAAQTQPQQAPATAPSADEVLGRMLKPRQSGQRELNITDPPLPDRTSGKGAVMPDAPVVTVLREGTPIVNRVGRITFNADGTQAELTFESDGQRLQDPPLIILPNLKLMAMEDAVRSASRDLRFRVSGVVTEYRGRNHVLLEKVTVIQDVTQQFK